MYALSYLDHINAGIIIRAKKKENVTYKTQTTGYFHHFNIADDDDDDSDDDDDDVMA